MARTTKNTVYTNENIKNNTVTHANAFHIIGYLMDVYEGKNYNYVTVKVENNDNEYYNLYRVCVDKDVELFDDGTTIDIVGTMSAYFDITTKTTTINLKADSLKAY